MTIIITFNKYNNIQSYCHLVCLGDCAQFNFEGRRLLWLVGDHVGCGLLYSPLQCPVHHSWLDLYSSVFGLLTLSNEKMIFLNKGYIHFIYHMLTETLLQYGMRPLLMAAWHGHTDAVRLLINCGASVVATNKVR